MVKIAKNRAVRQLRKIRKDLKLKNGNGNGGARRRTVARRDATIVLAQGAVAAPRKNFGTGKTTGRPRIAKLMKCLDARLPCTLGLPRAVGPYTVIRTTTLHASFSKFIMFCPFKTQDYTSSKWYDWCGVESVTPGDGVSAPDNTRAINMPLHSLGDACEVVPAAMTVQVMNPASLQQGDGVYAMARVNQQLALEDSPASLTWNEIRARVISFYAPRLLTGGKLALRGVKCNAYPLNMTDYSSFAPIEKYSGMFTWDNDKRPAALSPIVFCNNNADDKVMEFMITIEWRVRFDPGNPATASHTYHDVLQDDAWNELVKTASSAMHAVEELSEDAVNTGEAVMHAL